MNFIFDPSLVLYLPMYELNGSSFMSRDAYGHLCTVTGALWEPYGRYFDGDDDYITVPHHASLNFERTDSFTIEAFGEFREAGDTGYIVGKNQASGLRGYYFRYNTTTGTLSIYLSNNNTSTTRMSAIGATSVMDGAFHHVVAVYTGSSLNTGLFIYLDGVDDTDIRADTLSTTIQNTTDLRIGRRPSNDQPAEGFIGEVRIYNRALTPLEIQRNYLATKWRYQ